MYNLGTKLPKKYARFASKFMIYYEKVWILGNYHPAQWNYFQFDGSTSNNFLEGTNRKLSGDVLGTKPNPYKAAAKIKDLIKETISNVAADTVVNFGKVTKSKVTYKDKRSKLMDRIEAAAMSLRDYLHSLGILAFHYDRNRITRQRPIEARVEKNLETDEPLSCIHRIILPEDLQNLSCSGKTCDFSKLSKCRNIFTDILIPSSFSLPNFQFFIFSMSMYESFVLKG